MNLTQEQIENFKKQIIENINTSFPDDRKLDAIEKINSMNDEEFIEFLKKNKLLNEDPEGDSSQSLDNENKDSNPFRLIIEGKIPSSLIDENKDCLAVLEIKPISKGHIIIIPKEAISKSENIPKSIITLAKNISKRIKTKLKPKEVLISPSNILGEIIINLLPIYFNETLTSPRKQISQEELEELKKILGKKKKTKIIKKPGIKKIEEQKMWFPKRIP